MDSASISGARDSTIEIGQETWQDIGRQKRTIRDTLIPAHWRIDADKHSLDINVLDVPSKCGVLNDRELHITSDYDALDLVGKIRSGTFSAEEVTIAFCKRAAVAHQLTNCLTEIFFNAAISRAQSLDDERRANPDKPLLPFHGLPISLKDTYQITGIDASIGFSCYANQPSATNSALPELLLSLGAVLYCKTNVPQTMMTADSHNNIFGRTINPANRNLTAGGSTGGEGPLIALRGSILGFGTDLAGSIRIPALCNGIYGLKPSAGLIPFSGQRMPFPPGWESVGIIASAGMLATSSRACAFALETILQAGPAEFDGACVRIPWTLDRFTGPTDAATGLRIAVVTDDGLSTPTPPVRRALQSSIDKLQKAGVEIIHIRLPEIVEILSIIGEMFALDGSKHVVSLLESKQEPLVPSVENIGLLTVGNPKTIDEYFKLNQRRQAIWETYRELWKEHNMDAIIMPPAPYTAVPLDSWSTASYTAIFNLLDYPSMVVPVGTVGDEDVVDNISNAACGEKDQELYRKYTGPGDYSGAPVAIQIIGKRHADQYLMSICTKIDAILR
ncbi:amidase [Thozetella sp. PMI_491]|nr:amidase [Thozetella sp. PMI_491]